MTLRTTSATRRRVVSRSSEVDMTSATSSNRGSTYRCLSCGKCFSSLFRTEAIISMIAAVLSVPSTQYLVPRTATCDRLALVFLLGTRYLVLSLLARHDADVGQIPIAFRVVQSVAHNELIGNGEADV